MLVVNLIDTVVAGLVRRRRMAVSLVVALGLALGGCVTDAPVDTRDHAHEHEQAGARVQGASDETFDPDGDPDVAENGLSDNLDSTAIVPPSCPDPRNCGDPSSRADGGTP